MEIVLYNLDLAIERKHYSWQLCSAAISVYFAWFIFAVFTFIYFLFFQTASLPLLKSELYAFR